MHLSFFSGEINDGLEYAREGSVELAKRYKYQAAAKLLNKAMSSFDWDKPNNSKNLASLARICFQRIKMEYLAGNMENAIKAYCETEQHKELRDHIDETVYHEALLYTGKAHYYLNQATEASDFANAALLTSNASVCIEAKLLNLSALDLKGDYQELDKTYSTYLSKATQDEKPWLQMIVQMVETDYETCISSLQSARKAFESCFHFSEKRCFACTLNNLGIEYLMQGDFVEAKQLLHEAVEIFEAESYIEKHFPLNNLGLYYLLYEEDLDKALGLFEEALSIAISPLQQGYICMNLAYLFFAKDDFATHVDYLSRAQNAIGHTPDPVAHGYFAYNQAFFNAKKNMLPLEASLHKELFFGMGKKQNVPLIQKRNQLAQELSIEGMSQPLHGSTRRAYFAKIPWEPCELMFYS